MNSNSTTCIEKAFSARKRGDREKSLAYFQEGLALDPNNSWLPAHIAEDLKELGRLDEAEAVLEVLRARHPQSPHVPIGLGLVARKRGDREKSLANFQESLAQDPNNSWLPVHIAEDLRELGRLDEAEAFLTDILKKKISSGVFWNQLGKVKLFKDDSIGAIACFKAGIESEPDQSGCYLSLANELMSNCFFEEAESLLEKALKLAIDKKHIEIAKVRLLKAIGLYEPAIAIAEMTVNKYVSDFYAVNALVDLQISVAKSELAKDHLEAMDTLNPNEKFHWSLAAARLHLGNYDLETALQYVEAALALNDREVAGYQLLTKLHLMNGDSAAAKLSIQQGNFLMERSGSQRVRASAGGGLYFEIWKEFSMNPYAVKDLVALQGISLLERAPKICDILENEPNHAGSAMNLLVTLRRLGAWNVVNGPKVVDPLAKIPLNIVQFWDTQDVQEDIENTMKSWGVANPEFEYLIFNDQTALAFIEQEFAPVISKAFRMANHAAMRSDLFRLAYLYVNGGVYADADDMCRHAISPWLEEGPSLILLQEDLGSIGNNFIAAAPRHPFIRAALDQVAKNILEKQGDSIWFVSGPGMLTTLFCQVYLDDLRQCKLPHRVMIKDVYQVQQKISMHLPRAYKQDGRGWSSTKAASKPLFSRL